MNIFAQLTHRRKKEKHLNAGKLFLPKSSRATTSRNAAACSSVSEVEPPPERPPRTVKRPALGRASLPRRRTYTVGCAWVCMCRVACCYACAALFESRIHKQRNSVAPPYP